MAQVSKSALAGTRTIAPLLRPLNPDLPLPFLIAASMSRMCCSMSSRSDLSCCASFWARARRSFSTLSWLWNSCSCMCAQQQHTAAQQLARHVRKQAAITVIISNGWSTWRPAWKGHTGALNAEQCTIQALIEYISNCRVWEILN